LSTECSAAEGLPASLHDQREPGSSRSNRRTGRDLACIETCGQVTRHHNLLPSFLGRRSFAPPLSKGMIEYDHRDQILAFLLPASHSGRKFIEGPMALYSCCDRRGWQIHASRHYLKSTVLPESGPPIRGLMSTCRSQRVAERILSYPQTGETNRWQNDST
jgi:hypothetical protein